MVVSSIVIVVELVTIPVESVHIYLTQNTYVGATPIFTFDDLQKNVICYRVIGSKF